ncbi:hypothetical protein Tco_0195478 [Tanacetum coccineum]
MHLRDFHHFPGNRLATFSTRLASAPMTVGSPATLVVDLSDEDDEIILVKPTDENVVTTPNIKATDPHVSSVSVAARVIQRWPMSSPFMGRLEPAKGGPSSLVFADRRIGLCDFLASPGEANSSHDILSNLPYPDVKRRLYGMTFDELANFHDVYALKFVMANNMLNRKARVLSEDMSRLRNEEAREILLVHDLRAKNKKLVNHMANLQDLSQLAKSSRKVMKDDYELLRNSYQKFKEKKDVFLAMQASLRNEIEVLKDMLDSNNQECTMLVNDLLLHVVERLLSADHFSYALADLQEKDYEPDAEEIYDKVVDAFYLAKFPYLDFLIHHFDKILGKLMSLKPLILPPRYSSVAGPSTSHFL